MGTNAKADKRRMKPYASVIIAGYHSNKTIGRTLDSLEMQTIKEFETIVVNSSQETTTAELIKSRYPWVNFHQHPHRLLMHAARNYGVSMARGCLLLFTDPDLDLSWDWVERMTKAHRAGHCVLVGEMDCAQSTWMALGIHLTKFHFLLPNVKRKQFGISPTASAGYDRHFFEKIGEFSGSIVCGDALQSWKAIQAGKSIFCVRGVPVYHQHNHSLLQFTNERRQRGREFMTERIKAEHWSINKLRKHILLFPIIPFYVLLIAAYDAIGARWFLRYVWTVPVQFVGQLCWCFGELEAQLESIRGRR